ncbi:hypothetical protein T03_15171 [Trichinella britovi]|uniref:Uncharacterized protein n=1 Tax=Trichinella britovi TaxID=45882 RepID=A0A0V1DAG4_TRIBR|nr:hypothetical protein T03_15171 [Trichinella britovi]
MNAAITETDIQIEERIIERKGEMNLIENHVNGRTSKKKNGDNDKRSLLVVPSQWIPESGSGGGFISRRRRRLARELWRLCAEKAQYDIRAENGSFFKRRDNLKVFVSRIKAHRRLQQP